MSLLPHWHAWVERPVNYSENPSVSIICPPRRILRKNIGVATEASFNISINSSLGFLFQILSVFELSKRRWGSTYSLGGGLRDEVGVENFVRHGVEKEVGSNFSSNYGRKR